MNGVFERHNYYSPLPLLTDRSMAICLLGSMSRLRRQNNSAPHLQPNLCTADGNCRMQSSGPPLAWCCWPQVSLLVLLQWGKETHSRYKTFIRRLAICAEPSWQLTPYPKTFPNAFSLSVLKSSASSQQPDLLSCSRNCGVWVTNTWYLCTLMYLVYQSHTLCIPTALK